MLRKKYKAIAEIAIRLGCGSHIRSAAFTNTVPTIRFAAVENPKSSLNQTYQIPDELRSTR